jgi:hypothetical protein
VEFIFRREKGGIWSKQQTYYISSFAHRLLTPRGRKKLDTHLIHFFSAFRNDFHKTPANESERRMLAETFDAPTIT